MTTRLGDDVAGPLFADHHRVVRDRIIAHGGRRIESTGDGFLALFDSARSACACALAIQRELAAQKDGIRVRIGINAGEVHEGDDGLFGAAINLAKRVMDRAGGGEILVTDTVRQVAGTMPDAQFRDRGRVALKGFPERQRLYELRAADRPPPPAAPRRARSRRPALAGAAVLAVAAAAAGLAFALAASGGEEPVDVRPDSVAILDAGDGRVVGQVPVGVDPAEVVADGDSVWVANRADDSVTQIDRRSRRVVASVATGINIDGLGAGASGVWVADDTRRTARVIDPTFRTVARSLPIGSRGWSVGSGRPVAVTRDAVWIGGGNRLRRIDPVSHRVVDAITVGNDPTAVAVADAAVWVSDGTDGAVTRIDPRTDEAVATIPVGPSANGIAADAGGAWVAIPNEDRVKRVDAATNAVTDSVRVAGGPAALAIADGAVWVTSRRSGTVTRIDPRTARVTRTVRVGHSPQGIAVVGSDLWVAVQASPPRPDVTRDRGVVSMLRPVGVDSTDPAVSFEGRPVLHATCALLLNYPDRPFPEGAELRPEVAAAMPAVSDGGRTYTFRIRPGFRFSPPSNAPVTAAAFRRTIERALHPRTESFAAVIMSDVVGMDAFQAGRTRHLAGVSARGDRLTVRLIAPAGDLPARLASPMFCAVPPTTPIRPGGVEQIPMAGPYYVARFEPKRRLILRRNPNYRGDRPARVREIDIDLAADARRGLAAVEAGRADSITEVPIDRIAALERRFGPHSAAARSGRQRYFSDATPFIHWFALNTRRSLFADARMRRAVNAALDRPALAARVPIPLGAPGRPTDQVIPPGVPGFRDVTVHPLGGPDLALARRLAGGARHRRAVLVTCNLPGCIEHGRVAKRNLAAIGIDLIVKNLNLGEMFERLHDPGAAWDLGYFNYLIDFADPANFVNVYRSGDEANVGGFRDRDLQRRIAAAARLTGADRLRTYAELDADLARAAASAPFATGASTDFFAARIGCQVQQPIYGMSLGALCVRG